MSLTGTLQVGRAALATTSAAIQTAGSNISGSSDPTYSRQRVSVSATPGQARGDGVILGTGVGLAGVERQVDAGLTRRLNLASAEMSKGEEAATWLRQAEAAFNELTDADLSTATSRFLNSWGTLANEPQDPAARRAVLSEGESLARSYNDLHSRLVRLSRDAGERVGTYATDATRLTQEIAKLNREVSQAEGSSGGTANALRDRRDGLIGELSDLVGVHAIEDVDGSMNVYVGSQPVVLAGTARPIELEQRPDPATGRTTYAAVFGDGGGPLPVRSGRLAGTLDARATLDETIARIDAMADTLKFELNAIHATGQGTTGYASVAAEHRVMDATVALNDPAAGLDPAPGNGSFVVHLRDRVGGTTASTRIDVDLDGAGPQTSLDDLAAAVDAIGGVSASVVDGRLTMQADAGSQELVFGEDTANVLASLGVAGFFEGKGAANLKVRGDLLAEPGRLATSSDLTAGGNGAAARAAALADSGLASLGGGTLAQAYEATVYEVAAGVRSAENEAEAAAAITDSLSAQRSAISGVSLDEEAVQLMKYQRSYQGAARLIAAVDEMMETLLAIV
jgi:flagellar hook-associated protein 1 FlgK